MPPSIVVALRCSDDGAWAQSETFAQSCQRVAWTTNHFKAKKNARHASYKVATGTRHAVVTMDLKATGKKSVFKFTVYHSFQNRS